MALAARCRALPPTSPARRTCHHQHRGPDSATQSQCFLFPPALSVLCEPAPCLQVTRWLLPPTLTHTHPAPQVQESRRNPLIPFSKLGNLSSHISLARKGHMPTPSPITSKGDEAYCHWPRLLGDGLFPEPVDAQMREGTRQPWAFSCQEEGDKGKKRCWTATHIGHSLLLSFCLGTCLSFPPSPSLGRPEGRPQSARRSLGSLH